MEKESTLIRDVSVDVTVVGGGPVGMSASLALAAHGLKVALVEQRTGPSNEPKAISLDDESLRLYQAVGIVDRIMPIIVPGTGTAYFGDDGSLLFHARAGVPYRHGYPFKNPFAQPDLERVLYQANQVEPAVKVYFGHELIEIEQNDDEGVSSITQGSQGRLRIRSRFLIGADGGKSSVRKLAGIRMIGRSFDDTWLVVDTLGDHRTERYGMHHGESKRPHVVIPGLNGRCRYEWRLFDGEAEVGVAPPFDLIEKLVSRYRPITPEQVERAVCYKFNGLSAERWRSGNVFLVGDAAHMMPPFAGQGLNSGLRDVNNLAWKIAEAVNSPRSGAFLDSYEAERRPHAEAVIRSSVMLGRVVMTTNERAAQWRDSKVREALRTEEGRAFFEEMQYRPANQYSVGMIDPALEPGVGTQIGQPTVFDFRRRVQCPLDEVLGSGWALVGVDVPAAMIRSHVQLLTGLSPRAVSIPLDDHLDPDSTDMETAIDLDTRLYAEFAAHRGRLVLLRPDRFIAASWSPTEKDRIHLLTSGWLDLQSTVI